MKFSTVAITLASFAGLTAASPLVERHNEAPATYKPSTVAQVFHFTSTYDIYTNGAQVRNVSAKAPDSGSYGYFNFGINTHLDTICYNITLVDVIGNYSSPARTATHIHEAAYNLSGSPRIAFPNPIIVPNSNRRVSVGCLTAPFVTGINGTDGKDTGSASGFNLSQIEQNPKGFFTDAHTVMYPLGVVRGQLA